MVVEDLVCVVVARALLPDIDLSIDLLGGVYEDPYGREGRTGRAMLDRSSMAPQKSSPPFQGMLLRDH